MNDREFIDAVFYNSDGINWVKRYYTFEEVYDTDNEELRYIYRRGISEYLKSINVEVFQSSAYANEFLNSIGIIVGNKELSIKILFFPKDCDIDEVEDKIITEAKRFKYNIKPLAALIDLDRLTSLIDLNHLKSGISGISGVVGVAGMAIASPSFGKLIKPSKCISNTALFMIRTLEGLYARGNTVLVTDNFLFKPEHDNQYEIDLKAILKSLFAKEIIHYGESSKINQKMFDNVKEHLKKYGTTLIHKDIRDIHDRFWITKETNRGLVIGTSLNGIGKKLFYYNKIEDEDVVEVLNYLCE